MKNTSIFLATLAITPFAHGSERPNILLICIDDLRQNGNTLGADEAIIPNLEQFASEGRMFTHQYAQVPTSGASRACMLTGKYPKSTNNFAWSNSLIGSEESENPETFIHHLKRNGYHTVGMGKVSHSDNGYMYPENSEKVVELPYSWDEFIRDPNSPWADKFDAMLHSYDNGQTKNNSHKPAFEFLDLPDSCYADYQLANLAVAKLDELAKAQKDGNGEPTFMAVGFYKPHLPFVAPKRYWDLYEGVDIAISPTPDFTEGVSGVFMPTSGECFSYQHAEQGGKGIRLSDGYSRNLRRAYLSALSYTDTQVGKVLDKLHETGLDKNTIVIIWGDHGWCLGDHTIWGKHNGFERALNSAFMVRTPTMRNRGDESETLVAAIDIYPTICEYANVTPPENINGVSIVEHIERGKSKDNRECVVSFWGDIASIRSDRYRLLIYNNGKSEHLALFDHQNDSNESHNIADEKPEVVAELKSLLYSLNAGYKKF